MATILEEIDCEFVSSNVTDSTPLWDNTKSSPIIAKAKLQYDKYIYLNNTPDPIIFANYNESNTYAVGDISYKDGHVSIYSNGDGGVSPKMPSEYATHDTSMDSSVWANRYILLGANTAVYPEIALTRNDTDANLSISSVNNNGVYTYTCNVQATSETVHEYTEYKNPQSVTIIHDGSMYNGQDSIAWVNPNNILAKDGIYVTKQTYIAGDTSYTPTILPSNYDFSSIPDDAIIEGIEVQIRNYAGGSAAPHDYKVKLYQGTTAKGDDKSNSTSYSTSLNTYTYGGSTDLWGWTNITAADIKNSNFGVGHQVQDCNDNNIYLDSIQIKIYYKTKWSYSSNPTATNKVTSANVLTETMPTMHLDKSTYAYELKSLIVDGSNVYARTNKNVSYETKTVTTVWEAVQSPEQLGMIYIGYSNRFAPFDDTNNTPAVFTSPMTYVVKGLKDFNAFTLSKVLASSVTYTFKDPEGNVVKTATATIDCKRDPQGVLSLYPTTVALYADAQMALNSTIEITLTHDDMIKLGSFTVNNGVRYIFFTDLSFSKSSISYNNPQADEFGFISKGTKSVVTSFNIKTHMVFNNFKYSAPFLESVVDKWVTVDGADSWNGDAAFAPLVRRALLGDHTISSTVEDSALGEWIEATIMVKEII